MPLLYDGASQLHAKDGSLTAAVLVVCLGTSTHYSAARFLALNPRTGVLPACVDGHHKR